MKTTHHRILAVAALVGWGTVLVGCSAPASPQAKSPSEKPTTQVTETTAAAPAVATVPGYDVGQFPPVPLFTMPDISMLDSVKSAFAINLNTSVKARPGLDIRPAACGDMTQRAAGRGTAVLYGDGSGTYTGADGTKVNYGDGSGTFTVGGVTSTNYGDGSGSFESPTLKIQNYGDGSGDVTDARGRTQVYNDGSGQFEGNGVSLHNYGDGSAQYIDATVEIHNYGDGSGKYVGPGIQIENFGDGTGSVNGTAIKVEPIAKEAPIGKFPPMGALAPIESCGTTITLQDGVLFDFAKYDLRPDAADVLDELAATLNELKVPAAEISGHTDAIGSDEENQTLSENRASSVVAALTERGVSTKLTAEGYGETVPVAANEVDGHDNPAGRQLNRRVEIYIPAF